MSRSERSRQLQAHGNLVRLRGRKTDVSRGREDNAARPTHLEVHQRGRDGRPSAYMVRDQEEEALARSDARRSSGRHQTVERLAHEGPQLVRVERRERRRLRAGGRVIGRELLPLARGRVPELHGAVVGVGEVECGERGCCERMPRRCGEWWRTARKSEGHAAPPFVPERDGQARLPSRALRRTSSAAAASSMRPAGC